MSAAGAYYNENDPYAAQWLRNLTDASYLSRLEMSRMQAPSFTTMIHVADSMFGGSIDLLLAYTMPGESRRQKVARELRTQAAIKHLNIETLNRAANLSDGGDVVEAKP